MYIFYNVPNKKYQVRFERSIYQIFKKTEKIHWWRNKRSLMKMGFDKAHEENH